MQPVDRRAARQSWKERKSDWAIMLVTIGEQRWLKLVADPAAFERRIGFSLRTGSPPLPEMGRAYAAAGEVTIEVAERLSPEKSAMGRETEAKEIMARLAEHLKATPF